MGAAGALLTAAGSGRASLQPNCRGWRPACARTGTWCPGGRVTASNLTGVVAIGLQLVLCGDCVAWCGVVAHSWTCRQFVMYKQRETCLNDLLLLGMGVSRAVQDSPEPNGRWGGGFDPLQDEISEALFISEKLFWFILFSYYYYFILVSYLFYFLLFCISHILCATFYVAHRAPFYVAFLRSRPAPPLSIDSPVPWLERGKARGPAACPRCSRRPWPPGGRPSPPRPRPATATPHPRRTSCPPACASQSGFDTRTAALKGRASSFPR